MSQEANRGDDDDERTNNPTVEPTPGLAATPQQPRITAPTGGPMFSPISSSNRENETPQDQQQQQRPQQQQQPSYENMNPWEYHHQNQSNFAYMGGGVGNPHTPLPAAPPYPDPRMFAAYAAAGPGLAAMNFGSPMYFATPQPMTTPAMAAALQQQQQHSQGAPGKRPKAASSKSGGGGSPDDDKDKSKLLGSKKKRKPVEPKRAKRRTSNSTPTAAALSLTITSDDFGDRMVNPLVEVPEATAHGEPVHGAELFCNTDLVFHRPDTYPISYMARLLGFSVAVPSSSSPVDFPTPIGDIASLPLLSRDEDVFYKVPTAPKTIHNYRKVTDVGDKYDQHTLDYMDPVYSYVLKHSFSSDVLKSATSARVAKFVAQQKELASVRQKVVQQAQEIMALSNDWTFSDWTSFVESSREGRPRWTLDGNKVFSNPPPQTFGIIALYKGKPVSILKYQFLWYQLLQEKESEIVLVVEGFGKRTNLAVSPTAATAKNETPSVVVEPPSVKNETVGGCAPPNESAGDAASESKVAPVATDDINATAVPESKPAEGTKTQGDGEKGSNSLDQGKPQETMEGTTVTEKPLSANEAIPAVEKVDDSPVPAIPEEPLPDIQPDDSVLLTMLALVLEHTRSCAVLYGLWDVPKEHVQLHQKCFRMVNLPRKPVHTGQPMIVDLAKCSSRLAFLMTKQNDDKSSTANEESPPTRERLLVRLPAAEEAKSMYLSNNLGEMQRPKRLTDKANAHLVSGASGMARDGSVSIRVIADEKEGIRCFKLGEDGSATDELPLAASNMESSSSSSSHLDILRCFPIGESRTPPNESKENDDDDEILKQLLKKQADLLAAEQGLEPQLRSMLSKVVEDRIEAEKPEKKKALEEEKRILRENEKIIERRKEMDQAWQEQLEKDMNAVCNICNDGEVTPDNQILFCEACNVAIHQMCYGIEKVPEGDYYCIACRFFGRDKMQEDLASRLKRNPTATEVQLSPLPICCELCPVKQGAYIRTQTAKADLDKNPSDSKWVHMACAKWQGLQFLDKSKPEVVEDVTPLKIYFRKKDIACAICEGKRGAFHNCRHEGCEKWLHVTCARAVGTCEVVHGEDVEGPVAENPWSLVCTEHSDIDPENLAKEPVPEEQLVRMAKEFPDDVVPEPPPQEVKPFHKLNGRERAIALADREYENKIVGELLSKKFAGARCEVCDTQEDDGKNLFRCSSCTGVVCITCKLTKDDLETDKRFFKCPACKLGKKSGPEGDETTGRPECTLCFQKYGLLLKGVARPINKLSYWKTYPKEFAKSHFAKDLWAHYTCAFWLKGLQVCASKVEVDFSNAIMSNGRGFILQTNRCTLCGLRGGHKAKCSKPQCRARGERSKAPFFHVTCARQAGLEVNHSDDYEGEFYAHCYVHGGNEFNLRAKIEDLVEVEKRRSGKKMTRMEAPMNNFDASRLMNHSIVVVRVLGWAWRWAEWWVEYESNWEPLLEPGQKEKDLTKKELKIVDSTQESRRDDARQCRLAAFGAALRNRSYDTVSGFDTESFDRAIRAVLSTPSLVGPLTEVEIGFVAEWLGRAYRSKSKLLGLGDDKVPVAKDAFCVHVDDKTPKYELGNRSIPGKQILAEGQIFEADVSEPDDYLKPELDEHGKPLEKVKPLKIQKKPVKYKKDPGESKAGGKKAKETGKYKPDSEESKTDGKKSKVPDASKTDGKRSRNSADAAESSEPPKKRGRQAKPRDVVQSSSGEKRSSVASLAPSAVKRRSSGLSKWQEHSPTFWKRGGKDNFRFLEASILYETLSSPDGGLKKNRRGRPPKIWELPVVLRVGGDYFDPDEDASKGTGRRLFQENSASSESAGSSNKKSETKDSNVTAEKEDGIEEPKPVATKEASDGKDDSSSEAQEEKLGPDAKPPGEGDGVTLDETRHPEPSAKGSSNSEGIEKQDDDPADNSGNISSTHQDSAGAAQPLDEQDSNEAGTKEGVHAPGAEKPQLSAVAAEKSDESKPPGEEPNKEDSAVKSKDHEASNDLPEKEDSELAPKRKRGRPPSSPRKVGRPPSSPKKRGRPKSPGKAHTDSAKAPTPPGKKGKTKSPVKALAAPSALSDRPKRVTKQVVPMNLAPEPKRSRKRSLQTTLAKKKALKESTANPEEESHDGESVEDEEDRVIRKSSRKKRSLEAPTKAEQPAKRVRVARSASKKARQSIEATFIQENIPMSSSDSYQESSDDDKGDASEPAREPDEDSHSSTEAVPSRRYPRRSEGRTAKSDPEDDVPLSVLVESTKSGQDGPKAQRRGAERKSEITNVRGEHRARVKSRRNLVSKRDENEADGDQDLKNDSDNAAAARGPSDQKDKTAEEKASDSEQANEAIVPVGEDVEDSKKDKEAEVENRGDNDRPPKMEHGNETAEEEKNADEKQGSIDREDSDDKQDGPAATKGIQGESAPKDEKVSSQGEVLQEKPKEPQIETLGKKKRRGKRDKSGKADTTVDATRQTPSVDDGLKPIAIDQEKSDKKKSDTAPAKKSPEKSDEPPAKRSPEKSEPTNKRKDPPKSKAKWEPKKIDASFKGPKIAKKKASPPKSDGNPTPEKSESSDAEAAATTTKRNSPKKPKPRRGPRRSARGH